MLFVCCYLGVKKEHGTDDFLLQVTNYMKDVSISVLSDDNFSQVIYLEIMYIPLNFMLLIDDNSGIHVF